MLIEGDNLIRDFWDTLHDGAELGTGSTPETNNDTDLETPVSGSEIIDITTTTADQFLLKDANFHGTAAGDESVTEMIWKTISPEKAGSRITIPTITWEADRDLHIKTRWYFKGRQG